MADDTGGVAAAGAPDPTGVVAGSGVRVTVTDPLAPQDGEPRAAGVGLRRTSSDAPDPRWCRAPASTTSTTTSTRRTPWATPRTPPSRPNVHHALRRPLDARRPAPRDGGPDILDRHRNLFAVDECGRSEDTFSAGDGGYATNIDGPVRVIRSYLGANSGTYTQREHLFYRQHGAGADLPPGARHPRDHGLLRLEPGRHRHDATRARPRPPGHHRRCAGRRRRGRAHVGGRRRRPGRLVSTRSLVDGHHRDGHARATTPTTARPRSPSAPETPSSTAPAGRPSRAPCRTRTRPRRGR